MDGIEAAEFNQLVNQFIERKDPNAISFEALDEAARQQLGEVTTACVEFQPTSKRDKR